MRSLNTRAAALVGAAIVISVSTAAMADDHHHGQNPTDILDIVTEEGRDTPSPEHSAGHGAGPQANDHSPIGVMGDHAHNKGGFMLSYRFMRMNMDGNRMGTDRLSPVDIATTVPNLNPVRTPMGATVVPPFMRVVPTRMTMDMHMLGAMYAVSDTFTVMAMLPVIRKEMDHLTFQAPGMGIPPNNANVIGGFTTVTEGIGDVSLSGLFTVYSDATHTLLINLGLRAPTGSIEERDTILDPFGRTPNVRLPYAMQIGTGTWDLLPGLTYAGRDGDWSWGGQYRAEVRLEDANDNGWAFGDKHMVTGWVGYQFAPWLSTSVRAAYTTQGDIDGRDSEIGGPVQTANPAFYGGETLELFGGVNFVVTEGDLKGHRFAIEAGAPVYQDLNGVQMERDWSLTAGWQFAF